MKFVGLCADYHRILLLFVVLSTYAPTDVHGVWSQHEEEQILHITAQFCSSLLSPYKSRS